MVIYIHSPTFSTIHVHILCMNCDFMWMNLKMNQVHVHNFIFSDSFSMIYEQLYFFIFSYILGLSRLINEFTAPTTNTTKNNYIFISTDYLRGVIHNMKFICRQDEIMNGVSIVSKAVSSKSTLPILECILIEAQNHQIKLTANDMELAIETIIDGDILEEGKIAIEAKLFSEIIRKLPNNDVTIDVADNFQTKIICGKAKFNIMGKPGDDFSYLPQIEKEKFIFISQFTLKEVIRQTLFSISDNENNKLMTGELFEVKDNKLTVVSLDGHRISIRNTELTGENDPVKVVVPGKTLNDISKILSGELDDMVHIYFTDKHILFEMEKTKVVSRLLEGEYYRINRMLSNDYETKIVLNKKEIYSCIDRATLLIKESDKRPIILSVSDDVMDLQVSTSIGSMKDEMEIRKEGKDIMIGFNPKFLMDALRVIDDEEITIYMMNPKAPCFIKDEKESYIYLILPVNFNRA